MTGKKKLDAEAIARARDDLDEIVEAAYRLRSDIPTLHWSYFRVMDAVGAAHEWLDEQEQAN